MKKVFCGDCGLELGFKKLTSGKGKGKWCPTNPDGSDHWDTCREEQLKDPVYRKKMERLDKIRGKPVLSFNAKKKGPFYSGRIPPWDGRLGSFR